MFSPDLAVPGNRLFYERLGFLYVETADWREAFRELQARNDKEAGSIDMVVVETHGTNGTGLKLQEGKKPFDPRSYVAMGALQEALANAGVRIGVITACNSGRLFRPEIYNILLPNPEEPLFLPATLGIVHASTGFDATTSNVTLLRPLRSNLESLVEGDIRELSPPVVALFGDPPTLGDSRFVMSTLLIQILLQDPRLRLVASGYEVKASRDNLPIAEREAFFNHFLEFLDKVGTEELSEELKAGMSIENGEDCVTESSMEIQLHQPESVDPG